MRDAAEIAKILLCLHRAMEMEETRLKDFCNAMSCRRVSFAAARKKINNRNLAN
jgi:hypothetical protein